MEHAEPMQTALGPTKKALRAATVAIRAHCIDLEGQEAMEARRRWVAP